MKIRILYITHNRLEYTKLSLKQLFYSINSLKDAKIVIWDNASHDELKSFLYSYINHPKIEKIVFNQNNDMLWKPTNWFWGAYKDADFLCKVDDDCLVPDEWCQILTKAHSDIYAAGILGCWRFFPEDFIRSLAEKKIQTFNDHQIMRNCWVEGSGYLMKSSVIEKIGFLRKNETFTSYCIRASARGFINGWYYPFLFQEHMDDPRSSNTLIKTDDDFLTQLPLTAKNFNVTTIDSWVIWMRNNAKNLQSYSINPYDYIGIKAKLKRNIYKIFGNVYHPRMK